MLLLRAYGIGKHCFCQISQLKHNSDFIFSVVTLSFWLTFAHFAEDFVCTHIMSDVRYYRIRHSIVEQALYTSTKPRQPVTSLQM